MPRVENPESLVVVREEDRPFGLIVHALGWIPIWGFALNCAIWMYYKNRSREIIFHVQQAITFHIVLMIPVLVWAICSIFIKVIGALSVTLGGFLTVINTTFLSLSITACALVAIYGGLCVSAGKPFLYPIIGRRVLEGSFSKMTEE